MRKTIVTFICLTLSIMLCGCADGQQNGESEPLNPTEETTGDVCLTKQIQVEGLRFYIDPSWEVLWNEGNEVRIDPNSSSTIVAQIYSNGETSTLESYQQNVTGFHSLIKDSNKLELVHQWQDDDISYVLYEEGNSSDASKPYIKDYLFAHTTSGEGFVICINRGLRDFENYLTDEVVKDIFGLVQYDTDYAQEELTTISSSSEENDVSAKDASRASISQANALASAKDCLRYSAFSYSGLIKQLEYEKYSHEDAVYAADNCGANWKEQAARSAKEYLEFTSFSRGRLIDQLEYEGFTSEQAAFGADAVGL